MGNYAYPNVLVISHNVFSTTSNMGKTLGSFFSNWPCDNLAQLYFHSEVPNSEICKRYYRITDFDMLESLYRFKEPGKALDESAINLDAVSSRTDSGVKMELYQLGRKRKPYMYTIRNLLWGTRKWKTDDLAKWVEEFAPDIVFFASGDYGFSINIAVEICKERQIPLVVYFGDDYYFSCSSGRSLLSYVNKRSFRSKFKDMFEYLSVFIAASDKMQRKYESEFRKTGYPIMTPTELGETNQKPANKLKISYIGNLGLNRWKSIVDVGTCLKQLGYVLDVYSAEKRTSIISHLNPKNGIQFHGAISSSEVKRVIKESTVVLHVEAMDSTNRDRVRYSMSTKIAESLGSGVCLLAYGPEDVSSIEYLLENQAACVVTKEEQLLGALRELLHDDRLRGKYIDNALKLASTRHNFSRNNQLLFNIINKACKMER